MLGSKDALLEVGAPRIAPGEEAIARRSADGIGAVSIGEGNSLRHQAVEIRSLELGLGIESADIAVALIISLDDDHIRLERKVLSRAENGSCGEKRCTYKEELGFHNE